MCRICPITVPFRTYALCEGTALGVISSVYERTAGGIVYQAVFLTAAVFCGMLGAYTLGLIRPTARFVGTVVGMAGGICVFYLFSLIAALFEWQVPLLYGTGAFSIGFSVLVIAVAAANLIIDFGIIESGVKMGAPKYMEWYSGFGILVTMVWLYIEMLRLLSKLKK